MTTHNPLDTMRGARIPRMELTITHKGETLATFTHVPLSHLKDIMLSIESIIAGQTTHNTKTPKE